MIRLSLAALAAGTLTALGTAQVSNHSVVVGGSDAVDCQSGTTPPTLTGGLVQASALLDYTYDASTGMLTLVVSNTSMIVAGEANPVITHVGFNLPEGAVTGISLVSQAGSGGSAITFADDYSLDLNSPSASTKMGCMGYFNVGLADNRPGIANENAPVVGPSQYTVGPVTFEFQLTGPGTAQIDAQNIAAASSTGGFNAGAKFGAGGPTADESGFISSEQPDCFASMWLSAEPSIGSTVNLCAGAFTGCHGCLLVSGTPGPVQIGNVELPIGLPVVLAIPLPDFSAQAQCYPLDIPDDDTLVGVSIYMTVATTGGPANEVAFSPAMTLTVTQ